MDVISSMQAFFSGGVQLRSIQYLCASLFIYSYSCSDLLYAAQVPELEPLLTALAHDDAQVVTAAISRVRALSANDRAELQPQLSKALEDAYARLIKMSTELELITARQKLHEGLRKLQNEIVAYVHDEKNYPDGDAHRPQQESLNLKLDLLFELFGKGLIADPVLARFYKQIQFVERLSQLVDVYSSGTPAKGSASSNASQRLSALQQREVLALFLLPFGKEAFDLRAENLYRPLPATLPAPSVLEQRGLEQINRYRCMLGLKVLRYDPRLYRAAFDWARETVQHKLHGHFSSIRGKEDPAIRAQLQGHRRCIGECVSYSGTFLEDWRHSAAHHRALLDPQAVEGALAIYEHVAVLVTGLAEPIPPRAADYRAPATVEQIRLWREFYFAEYRWDGLRRYELEDLFRVANRLRFRGETTQAQAAARFLLQRDASHTSAHEILGNRLVNAQWVYLSEEERRKDKTWQEQLKRWEQALKSGDATAFAQARHEVLLADAREMLPWTIGAWERLAGVQKRDALEAARLLSLPGVQRRAEQLMRSKDDSDAWAGLAIVAHSSPHVAVDYLFERLKQNLSDSQALLWLDACTGFRHRMHCWDDRSAREEKLKALETWWRLEREKP